MVKVSVDDIEPRYHLLKVETIPDIDFFLELFDYGKKSRYFIQFMPKSRPLTVMVMRNPVREVTL